jgi:hypothetical protein
VDRRWISLLAAVLWLSVAGSTGCVADDETTTCSNFDEFLYECYYNCAPYFDCEDHYENLDAVSQQLLLDCSVCLQEKALVEDCSDCFVEGGWSCTALMEELIEVEGADKCEW